jgi:hypothetical protein
MKYKNQIVICILVFIVVFFVFYHTEEYQNVKPHYDCIITINVHEKIDFLLKQLANIKEYVGCNYAIILNCNDYMYEECNKIKSNNNVEHRRKELFHNVHINEEVINKSRNHGSLTHGIYSNMKLWHLLEMYFIMQ